MRKKYIFLLIFLFSLVSQFAAAQQQQETKADSLRLYGNIESYSRRSKLTKFIYRLIFKPVATTQPKKEVKKRSNKRVLPKPYSAFEGKIIRHIEIVTLDPFGYSIADTTVGARNFLAKTGNSTHVKTQHFAIRNLLLIHKNKPFDSLLVKESERLVRSQPYVRDVSFTTLLTSKNADSVDIVIRELDKWSVTAKILVSTTRTTVRLGENNFMGLGHEFKNSFTWYQKTGQNAYNTNYYIPNIRNTHTSTSLHYGTDEYRNFEKSFSIDRPFYSPFAKWAAGASFSQQFKHDSILDSNSVFIPQNYRFNSQDYYVGNSMQIFKGNSETNRTTHFISAIRLLRTRYIEKPIETYDLTHNFSSQNFYLASIAIATRKYIQDKYVFNYGVVEDVPIGKVYSITVGYHEKYNLGRMYAGARFALGNYYSSGYLSVSIEYGTFFRNSHAEEGTVSTGIIYFTNLIEIGKWKFRQFIKPQATFGINRLSSNGLSINDGYGIDGFNADALTGSNRLLFTLQTQSYAPWNFIGFRFGPYLIYSAGMLGNASSGFKNSKLYSQVGVGVLVKNENLVFNTFQISVSFYPIIPGNGRDIFKLNSFKTTDFGFRDFETGRPGVAAY